MSTAQLPPPPPPGTSYYGGLGPAILGISWGFCLFATLELSLRVYTAWRVVKNGATLSLLFALIAWAVGVVSSVVYTLAAIEGLGNHLAIVEFNPNLPLGTLYIWIGACTISFSVWFGKVSALCFIREVQGVAYARWAWVLYAMVGINLIFYIVTVPFIFTECNPSAKLWNPVLPGTCDGSNRAFVWAIITGVWGALTDAVLALYPVTMVLKLQLDTRLKATLCVLLGLGFFTAVASIVKTVQFGDLNASKDETYEIANLMVWGMAEMWIVIIASSMAPVWPAIRRTAEHFNLVSRRATIADASRKPSIYTGNQRRNVATVSGGKSFHHTRTKGSADLDQYSLEDGIHLTHEVTVVSDRASGRSSTN